MGSTELARAFVQIVPTAKGMKGSLTNLLSGEAQSAGDSAGEGLGKSLLGKLSGLIAAAGIGKMISDSINEGGQLQQSLGGVETLFKSNAIKVERYAAEAYKTVGLSANEYMQNVTGFSASLLQGLGGDTARAAEVANMAMVDMADNANKMGTDMGSIQTAYQGFAKQNYTMLDNLKLGYGGTKSEMERLLKDAQKFSGVKYDINNLADVYEAIHVIQGELDITGTTAKEAATTLEGSASAMKAAFKNVIGRLALGQAIGTELQSLIDTTKVFLVDNLLPMVGNVLHGLPQILSTVVTGIVGTLAEVAPGLLSKGVELFSSLAAGLTSTIPTVLSAATEVITGIISAIVENGPTFLEKGVEIVAAIGSGILSNTADALNAIGELIPQVVENITEFIPQFVEKGWDMIMNMSSGMSEKTTDVLEAIGNVLSALITAIQENLPTWIEHGKTLVANIASGLAENASTAITNIGSLLTDLVGKLMDALPDFLEQGVELIGAVGQGLLDNLPTVISAITSVLGDVINEIVTHLPDFLEKGISLIGEIAAGMISAIPNIIEKCGEVIQGVWDKFTNIEWGDIGTAIIDGIKNGISNAASSLAEAAQNAAQGALNALKNLLGIHSPSRVFRDQVGKMISAGWAEGIRDGQIEVEKAMSALGDLSTGMIEADLSADITGTAGVNEKLVNIMTQMLEYLGIIADQEDGGNAKINYREVRRILEDMGVVFA